MRLITQEIKFTGLDENIKINLSQSNEQMDSDDIFNAYITEKNNENINDATDLEKFKYKSVSGFTIVFNFFTEPMYNSTYINAGFTSDDILYQNESFKNSFYIIDTYDSYDNQTQNKLNTMYFTTLGTSINSIYRYDITGKTNNQFATINIKYTDEDKYNIITGYTRISFYNAKLGKLHVFYDSDNILLTTDEKYYIKTFIDFNNRTFKYLKSSPITLTLNELVNNVNYLNKFNRSLDIKPLLQQIYSTGNTFNIDTRNYVDIE